MKNILLVIIPITFFFFSCEDENMAPIIEEFSISLVPKTNKGEVLINYKVSDSEGDDLTIIFRDMYGFIEEQQLYDNEGKFETTLIVNFGVFLELEVTDSHQNVTISKQTYFYTIPF